MVKYKDIENGKALSAPLQRISVLDSLRGFALLGVILIHMLQHFGIGFGFANTTQGIFQFPVIDNIAQWIGNNIIMGRFINIFALLFGLSFFIQMDRAAKKGIDFRGRFVWRMILLMLLGVLSHSFYSLEIISIYGFFGLLMIPLYKVKKRVLLILCAVFLLGIPRFIQSTHHNYEVAIGKSENVEISINNSQREVPKHISNPSFLNSVKHNYKDRFTGKLTYQFSYFGRGYITFALFLFGLFLGRIRFFEKLGEHKKRNLKIFIGLLAATILLIITYNLLPNNNFRVFFRADGMKITSSLLFAKAIDDISLVISSITLAMGFILLYQFGNARKYLDILAPYGRTALTNYLLQGLIGFLLFSSWAWGNLFNEWGAASLFLLGLIIYVLQIVMSKIWLRYFLYGPLEWLWRSLTYLEIQSFSKK